MSPEQSLGQQDADPRGDLYSLGAVAYFLLTGRPPFDQGNTMAIMVAHARDPVTPPSQFHADTPADLEEVVLRRLAKRPEHRYQTAEQLDAALAACKHNGTWSRDHAQQWWSDHSLRLNLAKT